MINLIQIERPSATAYEPGTRDCDQEGANFPKLITDV